MPLALAIKGHSGWSIKFSPTPGRLTIHFIPNVDNSFSFPIPDNIKIFGVIKDPEASITSLFANSLNTLLFVFRKLVNDGLNNSIPSK